MIVIIDNIYAFSFIINNKINRIRKFFCIRIFDLKRWKKYAFLRKNLDAMVSWVCNINSVLRVCSDSQGGVEMTVFSSFTAKTEPERTVFIKHFDTMIYAIHDIYVAVYSDADITGLKEIMFKIKKMFNSCYFNCIAGSRHESW